MAKTPEEFFAAGQAALEQVAANQFLERARALAQEIADRRPHLVRRYKVYYFTLEGRNGPPPFRDHLADLVATLADRRARYRVAVVVQDMNLAVSQGGNRTGCRSIPMGRR